MKRARNRQRPTTRLGGFTLVELLVVVLIILLVSAVVLPAILPDLLHGQTTEGARMLQAAFTQARAEAVKNNAARGIRLLPDPTYLNSPSILAFNRWVAIEPAPDYSNGLVTIWPVPTNGEWTGGNLPVPFVAPYPVQFIGGETYPYLPGPTNGTFVVANNVTVPGTVLMIEQAPYAGNDAGRGINNPTSWFWNVRVGDKIQINNSGRSYTIVGPCVQNPSNGNNPELFVNDGPPGQTPMLSRPYFNTVATQTVPTPVEYLYVVNGIDDNGDGYTDEGWDGFNNNFNLNASGQPLIDDVLEWFETETFGGAERSVVGQFNSYTAAVGNSTTGLPLPAGYTISRRPVPSPGAREFSLPKSVVIDATTWNTTRERSRLPIDPSNFTVEVLFNPNGSVVLTTEYSSPTAFAGTAAFFHFWIAERQDVQEATPLANVPYLLPMPEGTQNYPNSNDSRVPVQTLKGQRSLVTLFARTGQITTNSLDFFDGANINTPFYDSQLGAREAK